MIRSIRCVSSRKLACKTALNPYPKLWNMIYGLMGTSWHEDAYIQYVWVTVYPKKYAHGFCFAVLCCGYTLTDFPISIRLTSLALWQSNDCPSASKATLMNIDKYFMWIHYEGLHNHNKAKHNKTVCIFLGIYCMWSRQMPSVRWGLIIKMCQWTGSSLVQVMDCRLCRVKPYNDTWYKTMSWHVC